MRKRSAEEQLNRWHSKCLVLCLCLVLAGCSQLYMRAPSPDQQNEVKVWLHPGVIDYGLSVVLRTPSRTLHLERAGVDRLPTFVFVSWSADSKKAAVLVLDPTGGDLLRGYDIAAGRDLDPIVAEDLLSCAICAMHSCGGVDGITWARANRGVTLTDLNRGEPHRVLTSCP